MANLSVEEPYALMRARTGLWEPWAGNCPGPPGQEIGTGKRRRGAFETDRAGYRLHMRHQPDDFLDLCSILVCSVDATGAG
jgi:hypothetical protein